MSKKTDDYLALAQALNLNFDKVTEVVYGEREDFNLAIYAPNANLPYMLCIHTAAKDPAGRILTKDDFKELTKNASSLGVCQQEGNNIIANLRNYPKRDKLIAAATEGVDALIGFLKNKGFAPCCSTCGQSVEMAAYQSGSSYFHLCENCASNMLTNADKMLKQKAEKNENIIGGIIGAFIGSLLGLLCIVLFGMAGYVAAVSGAVMAVGALKGYEILGGKLSKLGVAVSVVFMVVMILLGNRLSTAIELMKKFGDINDWNLMECFSKVPDSNYINQSVYFRNLAMIFIFAVLGAVPVIKQRMTADKTAGQIVKIGGSGNFGSHTK